LNALRGAREYARRHDVTLSSLVSRFLDGSGMEDSVERHPPALRRLVGILPPDADEAEYDRHRDAKYGA
jgi:hypothetical protein